MVHLSIVNLLNLLSCFCGGMYQHTQEVILHTCYLVRIEAGIQVLCMRSESIGIAWAQCFNAFKAGMSITRRETDHTAASLQYSSSHILKDTV